MHSAGQGRSAVLGAVTTNLWGVTPLPHFLCRPSIRRDFPSQAQRPVHKEQVGDVRGEEGAHVGEEWRREEKLGLAGNSAGPLALRFGRDQ